MNTPLTLQILIHACTSNAPFENAEAPAVKEEIARLETLGVIRPTVEPEKTFNSTPKGNVWLKIILRVPMPTPAFLDENGKVIE